MQINESKAHRIINLLWFVDRSYNSFNAERHVFMVLVTTIEKTDSLVAGLAPVVEESFH